MENQNIDIETEVLPKGLDEVFDDCLNKEGTCQVFGVNESRVRGITREHNIEKRYYDPPKARKATEYDYVSYAIRDVYRVAKIRKDSWPSIEVLKPYIVPRERTHAESKRNQAAKRRAQKNSQEKNENGTVDQLPAINPQILEQLPINTALKVQAEFERVTSELTTRFSKAFEEGISRINDLQNQNLQERLEEFKKQLPQPPQIKKFRWPSIAFSVAVMVGGGWGGYSLLKGQNDLNGKFHTLDTTYKNQLTKETSRANLAETELEKTKANLKVMEEKYSQAQTALKSEKQLELMQTEIQKLRSQVDTLQPFHSYSPWQLPYLPSIDNNPKESQEK